MRIRDLEEYKELSPALLRAYLVRMGWTVAKESRGIVLWRHTSYQDVIADRPASLFYPDSCVKDDQPQEEACVQTLCRYEQRGPQAILRDITGQGPALADLAHAARAFRDAWGAVADLGRVTQASTLQACNDSDVALSRALAHADMLLVPAHTTKED